MEYRRLLSTTLLNDVREGAAAQVLAAVRNAAVHLLGKVNPKNKAAATRRLAAHPKEALPLLFL